MNGIIVKINQKEIAKRLGISHSYVNKILNGKRSSPKYEKLIKRLINAELRSLKAA